MTVTEYVVDFDTARIVPVQIEKVVTVGVPTGEMGKRFGEDWELRAGELYRRPTLDDLDVVAILADSNTELPQWILDRLPAGSKQSASLPIEKVMERLNAKLNVDSATEITKTQQDKEIQIAAR